MRRTRRRGDRQRRDLRARLLAQHVDGTRCPCTCTGPGCLCQRVPHPSGLGAQMWHNHWHNPDQLPLDVDEHGRLVVATCAGPLPPPERRRHDWG